MSSFKRIMAFFMVLVMVFAFSACKKKDEDSVLTTKKKTRVTTEKTDSDIDIWAFLNGENGDTPSTEEPATIPAGSSGSLSSGNYSYEDTPVGFNGSNIFSSATTSKGGYHTNSSRC